MRLSHCFRAPTKQLGRMRFDTATLERTTITRSCFYCSFFTAQPCPPKFWDTWFLLDKDRRPHGVNSYGTVSISFTRGQLSGCSTCRNKLDLRSGRVFVHAWLWTLLMHCRRLVLGTRQNLLYSPRHGDSGLSPFATQSTTERLSVCPALRHDAAACYD